MSGNEGPDVQDAPTQCENCGTPLQGHYCHVCGQSVHSPTRHFGHAMEEVFESFWHLDGRVFRTLRDLFSPGRIALNYLAGQRARYIPPVRLFLVLSVLTFFIARLTMHVDADSVAFNNNDDRIASAQTVEAVVKERDAQLAKLAEAEHKAAQTPGANFGLIAARARIQGEASARIAKLNEQRKAQGKPPVAAPDSPPDGYSSDPHTRHWVAGQPVEGEDEAASTQPATQPAKKERNPPTMFDYHGKPWNAQTNPVEVDWLPGFANRWLNRKLARAQTNIQRMDGDPNAYLDVFLGALPTALFLLMPVFALLLKVCYLGSGRRYLEHIVVALYSHAYLLLTLLAMFLLTALPDQPKIWSVTTGLGMAALWIWTPIYLFKTQRRVYGEGWLLTTTKYLVIGSVYLVLVGLATTFAAVEGIVH